MFVGRLGVWDSQIQSVHSVSGEKERKIASNFWASPEAGNPKQQTTNVPRIKC